jgi:hypothetical protein
VSRPCRECGSAIDWGFDPDTQRWVPLEPVETHADLPRSFVDEDGLLRADHRERHGGGATTVTRLRKKVPAEMAEAHGESIAAVVERPARRDRPARRLFRRDPADDAADGAEAVPAS